MRAEIIGVCTILGSIYLALSLYSYNPWDPSVFTYTTVPPANFGGRLGAHVADILVSFLGLSAYALPVFVLAFGLGSLLGRERRRVHLAGAVLLVVSASLLATLLADSFRVSTVSGGLVGRYGGGALVAGLSVPGAYLLALGAFLCAVILLSPVSVIAFLTSPRPRRDRSRKPSRAEKEQSPEAEDVPMPLVVEPPLEVVRPPGRQRANRSRGGSEGYELPDLELLRSYEPVRRQSRDQLRTGSALLERKLEDFAIQGRVVKVHTGPVVTMYEFEPAPGVKINRVVSLADDLALALRAQSIRIAPIPGKAAIGIEIPNAERETVSLRETVGSEAFQGSASRLTLALGKDIFGTPVVADLARMPHLLVAGATGAGKSVALNAMVMSLLYKARPDEVRMLMIDPKLLEFSAYEGIPHLVSPVVTNPKEAAEMLRKMVFEMERRYRLIAERGVRNIESFNAAAPPEERLPYIVIVIDELADLMFASASQVEDSIARLAQMARASGMHLIIATQRPSVDVITGMIKANFPARIAFQVTSRVDSRTILDAQGAEQLIGRGDMLFMRPGSLVLRVHGALVTEAEVRSAVEFVRAQGSPDFGIIEEISRAEAEATAEAEHAEDRDELYLRALDFAEAAGEVSISSIQRRLKVGYNRAARIMDLMEEDGLVGPPRGAGKPRDFVGRRRL
jgi:S-DNA-T family DNA segregation ATPase FtsK/SpoIIIE